MLGPREEELLSWLQGRRPLGEPVRIAWSEIRADLGYQTPSAPYQSLARLARKGFVERTPRSEGFPISAVRVVRRLETAA